MYGERLFFTYTGSDGVERELTPGGVARRVTFDNRLAFCRMVEQARTHEFDAQVSYGWTLKLFPLCCTTTTKLSCYGRIRRKYFMFNSALYLLCGCVALLPLLLQQAAAMAAGLSDIVPIKVRKGLLVVPYRCRTGPPCTF